MKRVITQLRAELMLIARNGEQLLLTLVIPLILLGFFGSVDILPSGDADPLRFLVPGVIAEDQDVTAAGQFERANVDVTQGRQLGYLLRITGLKTRAAWFAARILLDWCSGCLASIGSIGNAAPIRHRDRPAVLPVLQLACADD